MLRSRRSLVERVFFPCRTFEPCRAQKKPSTREGSSVYGAPGTMMRLCAPFGRQQGCRASLAALARRTCLFPMSHVRTVPGTKKPSTREGSSMYGAPGTIRTCDRLVRSQVLYPAELRALKDAHYAGIGVGRQGGVGWYPPELGGRRANEGWAPFGRRCLAGARRSNRLYLCSIEGSSRSSFAVQATPERQ